MEFKNGIVFLAVLCSASSGNILLSRADSSHEFLLVYTQNATTISPTASTTQKTQQNTTLKFIEDQPTDLNLDEKINVLSANLVSAIISKLEIESQITNLVLDSLAYTERKKVGVKAIKTRRVLEYISRKMSIQIMKFIKTSEMERSKLLYGLAQTAAEVAIISALEDITFANALITQYPLDMSLRKKRSFEEHSSKLNAPALKMSGGASMFASMIIPSTSIKGDNVPSITINDAVSRSPFYVMTNRQKTPIRLLKGYNENHNKGFMNTSISDFETKEGTTNKSQGILIHGKIKETVIVSPSDNFDMLENHTSKTKFDATFSDDDITDVEQDMIEKYEEKKKPVAQMDILDKKAEKALDFCGEVALNAAGSAVALRRSLTAAIEVKMSVISAKKTRASRKSIIMNLAKSAARQAGKEAKIANAKSMASEKALQEASKLTAISTSSALNPAAGRLMIGSICLAALAKSMAYVASEVAIDALYQVADVKHTQ